MKDEVYNTDLEWIGDAPYTKEEVEAMILEYADPNDDMCKVMLANVGKSRVVAPSVNAKPITLDELGQTEAPKEGEIMDVRQNLEDNFKPLHGNKTTVDYDFARKGANPTLKALEQTGFLLNEPQASSVNDYILAKENEALKREVEAGKEKIKK